MRRLGDWVNAVLGYDGTRCPTCLTCYRRIESYLCRPYPDPWHYEGVQR